MHLLVRNLTTVIPYYMAFKFLVVTRAMSFRAWMMESYLQILQYRWRAPKDMDKLTSKLKTLHELDAIVAQQTKRTVLVP